MLIAELKSYLANPRDELSVRLSCIDKTRGETEEIYFITGERVDFENIVQFTATALLAMGHHMGVSINDCVNLEVDAVEPETWRHAYNPTLFKPGGLLCFPTVKELGFEPPKNLYPKLCLTPDIISVEECFVCESPASYVFLYWYTTG
jgi:hypothetical protein